MSQLSPTRIAVLNLPQKPSNFGITFMLMVAIVALLEMLMSSVNCGTFQED